MALFLGQCCFLFYLVSLWKTTQTRVSSSLPKWWIFMPLSCSIKYRKPTHFQTSNAHRHLLRAISLRDCIYTFLNSLYLTTKMLSSSNFQIMLQTTTKSSLHFSTFNDTSNLNITLFFYLYYYAPVNHFATKEPAKKINANVNVNHIHELLNCVVAERCSLRWDPVQVSCINLLHLFQTNTYKWTLQVMASWFNDTLMAHCVVCVYNI